MFNPNILCLIPARSGSKGIRDKNIKSFKGKPLLVWSIEQAKKCDYKMRIIVSTDSEKYKKISIKYGAEVPFLRPKEISQDKSTDIEFIKHAVDFLEEKDNYIPDIILQLRPTQPLRKIEDINNCLKIFIENYEDYDSLRTIIEYEKSPFKMYTIQDYVSNTNTNTITNTITNTNTKKKLQPLFDKVKNIKEPFNQCRQFLPKTYLHNGYIDIIKTSILINNTISGQNIYPYIMNKDDTIDIDTMEDWIKAENQLIMND